MMVLAVESSGTVAAVAVANEDKLVGEFFLIIGEPIPNSCSPCLRGF